MEETINTQPEVVEEVAVQQENPTADTQPTTPQELLNQLISRRNGEFEVKMSHADLKFIKNTINTKIEWKGPNEAYLVIMTVLTLDNALEAMDSKDTNPSKIKLPASTIESINFFLTKVTGKGLDGAQRIFSTAMQLRQVMEALRKLDDEIKFLKDEVDSTSKQAN